MMSVDWHFGHLSVFFMRGSPSQENTNASLCWCSLTGASVRLARQRVGSFLSTGRAATLPTSALMLPYDAETITERVAAKRDRRASTDFEFLLAFRTGVHCLSQECFKIVDVKVNVNWCPVSVIPANIISPHSRLRSRRFLYQSDLRVSTFENDVRRNRSSDLGKSQGVAIEPQSLVKLRDVN